MKAVTWVVLALVGVCLGKSVADALFSGDVYSVGVCVSLVMILQKLYGKE